MNARLGLEILDLADISNRVNALKVARKKLEGYYERDVYMMRGSDYAIASMWARSTDVGGCHGDIVDHCDDVEEVHKYYFFLPRHTSNSLMFLHGHLVRALSLIAGEEDITQKMEEFNKNGLSLHYNYDAQIRDLLLRSYPKSKRIAACHIPASIPPPGMLGCEYIGIGLIERLAGEPLVYVRLIEPSIRELSRLVGTNHIRFNEVLTRDKVEELMYKEYIEPEEFAKLDLLTQVTILYLRGILEKDVIYRYNWYDTKLYFALLTPKWFIERFGSNNIMVSIKDLFRENFIRWKNAEEVALCHEKKRLNYNNYVEIEYAFIDVNSNSCGEGRTEIYVEPFDPHKLSTFRI